MLRHLKTCKKRFLSEKNNKRKNQLFFQIVVTAKNEKYHWLILEVAANTTLEELDQFIRDIWLECCSHLSMFICHGVHYDSHIDVDDFFEMELEDMIVKLEDIVDVGDTMQYEYDFGSTTHLAFKIQDAYIKHANANKITIQSRNNPIKFLCSHCHTNEATWINPQAYDMDNLFWCEKCLEEDEDSFLEFNFLLPVCNSPRMGECAYEGSSIFPDQFEPDEKD